MKTPELGVLRTVLVTVPRKENTEENHQTIKT